MKKFIYIFAVCACASAAARTAGPISPLEHKDGIRVVDTLPTDHENVRVVLYNDNSWRYVRNADHAKNLKVYTENWTTSTLFAYSTHHSELPEVFEMMLIDEFAEFHYPYKTRVVSKFGPRGRRQHQGVDLSLDTGDPVYAPFNGRVRISERNGGGYGEMIILRHDCELETTYGHLSERLVEEGDWVEAGQIIGFGGSTGRSSGPHLHFETRYRGHCFDPEWIFDFANGTLHRSVFLLRKAYMDIDVNAHSYVPEVELAGGEEDGEHVVEKPAPKPKTEYYRVKPGDTLIAISRRYNTSVETLCRINGIKNADALHVGARIRVK